MANTPWGVTDHVAYSRNVLPILLRDHKKQFSIKHTFYPTTFKTDFLKIDLIPKQFELLVPDWLEIEETNYLLYLLLKPFRNKSL